ncbi:MAG: hypothetical protein QOI00_478 [Chloroflexota bacterium]|jgi:hypothetical protein|nr:hypothetical protein [Chloroflexota bacterium]
MAIRQDTETGRKDIMSAAKPAHDHRRHRLATNDNETVVEDDVKDTEGHRLATNDNETTVPNPRRIESPDEDDEATPLDAPRQRYR